MVTQAKSGSSKEKKSSIFSKLPFAAARKKYLSFGFGKTPTVVLAALGSMLVAAFYCWIILSNPTMSPELALAYVNLKDIDSIFDVLKKFLDVKVVWYRPFTFAFSNFLMFKLIDIHDIVTIKTVSMGIILSLAFLVTKLSKVIFHSGIVERSFLFALLVSHPLYFTIAIEGSGITDPIFNIFICTFLIGLLKILSFEDRQNKTRKNLLWPVFLCCLSLVGAITSHERGVAIFSMLLSLVFYKKFVIGDTIRSNKYLNAVNVFAAICAILYFLYVYSNKGQWRGQDYRTDFDVMYVIPNIVKGLFLPIRMHVFSVGKVYDVHAHPLFNVFALPMLICLVWYIRHCIMISNRDELRRAGILIICWLCSLPIPIIFGGMSWHFFTGGMFVSILQARAFSTFFYKIEGRRVLAPLLSALFFVFLTFSSQIGLKEELHESSDFMLMLDRAMKDPVLKIPDPIPDVVFYDTGSLGTLTWPFGGQGNLFKYLYRNPNIIEIAIQGERPISSDIHLCKTVHHKKVAAFGYDTRLHKWNKIESVNYCRNDLDR